ncbi:conserved Plasmodium protein, unknown function [Plasmodium sp. DRC-Itaito]|nr:conserved Plasmodium protein, unknown function [Plasmodium sp. DRC-Itaito]
MKYISCLNKINHYFKNIKLKSIDILNSSFLENNFSSFESVHSMSSQEFSEDEKEKKKYIYSKNNRKNKSKNKKKKKKNNKTKKSHSICDKCISNVYIDFSHFNLAYEDEENEVFYYVTKKEYTLLKRSSSSHSYYINKEEMKEEKKKKVVHVEDINITHINIQHEPIKVDHKKDVTYNNYNNSRNTYNKDNTNYDSPYNVSYNSHYNNNNNYYMKHKNDSKAFSNNNLYNNNNNPTNSYHHNNYKNYNNNYHNYHNEGNYYKKDPYHNNSTNNNNTTGTNKKNNYYNNRSMPYKDKMEIKNSFYLVPLVLKFFIICIYTGNYNTIYNLVTSGFLELIKQKYGSWDVSYICLQRAFKMCYDHMNNRKPVDRATILTLADIANNNILNMVH